MQNRYVCDFTGAIICQNGWKELNDVDQRNPLYPCLEPVCDYEGETCQNGICKAPDHCACEIGWEGTLCEICIPLPGCVHGNCSEALECNCMDGWTGPYCDTRKYKSKYKN